MTFVHIDCCPTMARLAGGHKVALAIVSLLIAVLLTVRGTDAHELRPAIGELSFDGSGGYAVTLTLNLEVLIAGIGPEHDDTNQSPNARDYDRLRALGPSELGAEFEAFADTFLGGIEITADGSPVGVEIADVEIPETGDTSLARISTVVLSGEVPPGAEAFTWAWDAAFGANIIATRGEATAEDPKGPILYSALLTEGQASAPIPVTGGAEQSLGEVFVTYGAIGFEHILPKGLDHILFVVGLFLLNTRFRTLLIQVTSFTVAHTITLALGTLGVVQIAPSIVEPLIAASIVYVCIENIASDRLQRWRPAVVFAFGLLHGLGFAGVLAEVGLAPAHFLTGLIAFNLGVEVAQLTIVAACFLAVGLWFGNKPYYRAAITIPASVVIALIGGAWFVERVWA